MVHDQNYGMEVKAAGPYPFHALIVHRTKFRREANQADNKAATTAVDSLINYEAVKARFLGYSNIDYAA